MACTFITRQNYQKQLIQMADEAKRANMAKTDFLRRMSHDMRTPINAINGYVRIAGAFPDDQVNQLFLIVLFDFMQSLLIIRP